MVDLLHSVISEYAKNIPDKAVIEDGNTIVTYSDLETLSNRFANLLVSLRISKGEPVLLLSRKFYKSIISIFGIIKAGCILVPVNINDPFEKIYALIKKYAFTCFVLDKDAFEIFERNNAFSKLGNGCRYILLESNEGNSNRFFDGFHSFETICNYSDKNPKVNIITQDIAYIIFTSGSTGEPKGVMIPHGSITPVIRSRAGTLFINYNDRLLSLAPQNFDMFIIELFCVLCNGGTIVLINNWVLVNEVLSAIERHKITMIITVPTLFTLILRRKKILSKYNISSLKKVAFGGGKCLVDTIKQLDKELCGVVDFYHGYGLTETSCHALYYKIENIDCIESEVFPLGEPINNTEYYILDSNDKPVKEGEVGELVIRGYHLMNGYYKNDEDTSRVLKNNPFFPEINEKVLYTGDLVKKIRENIYFVSRKDEQVKCSGHRIELGEIEAYINSNNHVLECAVVAIPDRDYENLLYCFVSLKDEEYSEQDLKKFCTEKLPSYMRPHTWFIMQELPKNQNRKIDKIKLKIIAMKCFADLHQE